MTEYADLEIGLHRRDAVTYSIELRLSRPGTDADNRLTADGPLVASIDPAALDAVVDDEEYGLALGRALFGGGLSAAFREAVAASQASGVRMRVRLVIGPSASRLHALRWETLRDPVDGSTLLTNENVVFSRYLSSNDWRPVGAKPRGELTALAVVASPSDLDTVGRPLAPVETEAELVRAREALAGLRLTEMAGPAARPTRVRLVEGLRAGYDVLYLVCHGYLHNDEPVILLEDEDGRCAPLLGSELVERLRELARTPRLVVLASCQSAGAGADRSSADAGVLAALGPRLAESGVPAVVAMQGNISMTTAAAFSETFFRALGEDGLVDRATAVARSAVRDRPDWWVPALFMRLRTGRLWYEPGSAADGRHFDKWPSLVRHIAKDQCTPVVGPGIADALLGSRQEIARSWATRYRYPMAPHDRESLPQVAQYLSTSQNSDFPSSELESHLRTTLLEQYGEQLPAPMRERSASLDDLITAAWEVRYQRGGTEPYAVLAEMPSSIYITTQPSQLLARALAKAGRRPEVELCRWREGEEDLWPESVYDREPGYRPTVERPLVYHLLGAITHPDSLVLTEDDYFDFLIGVTRNKELVPTVVRAVLANSALMFLGFRIDEWDFRVLYRSLMNSEGDERRKKYTHVAVQIDPEEDSTVDAERARRYLESYFRTSHVSLYWGSTENFVKELEKEWGQRP